MFCFEDEYEEGFICFFSLLRERVSASVVSWVALSLDWQVRCYHQWRLGGRYPFIFFDGVVLRQKGVVWVQRKIILNVYEETWDKKRKMIDFLLASSESQVT